MKPKFLLAITIIIFLASIVIYQWIQLQSQTKNPRSHEILAQSLSPQIVVINLSPTFQKGDSLTVIAVPGYFLNDPYLGFEGLQSNYYGKAGMSSKFSNYAGVFKYGTDSLDIVNEEDPYTVTISGTIAFPADSFVDLKEEVSFIYQAEE